MGEMIVIEENFGNWTQRWRLMGVRTWFRLKIERECYVGLSAAECYGNVTFALKTNCTRNVWLIRSVKAQRMCGKA